MEDNELADRLTDKLASITNVMFIIENAALVQERANQLDIEMLPEDQREEFMKLLGALCATIAMFTGQRLSTQDASAIITLCSAIFISGRRAGTLSFRVTKDENEKSE